MGGGQTNTILNYISGVTDTNKNMMYYILYILILDTGGGRTHHFQNRDGRTDTFHPHTTHTPFWLFNRDVTLNGCDIAVY